MLIDWIYTEVKYENVVKNTINIFVEKACVLVENKLY